MVPTARAQHDAEVEEERARYGHRLARREPIQQITDLRGTAEYRRVLIKDLFRKFIAGDHGRVLPPFGESRFPSHSENDMPHESAIGNYRYKLTCTGNLVWVHRPTE